MDNEGWPQPQAPAQSHLPSSLPSPSPCPEKIFSEVTPKCEKCHNVVKPGEPRGQGPTQRDLGWDPHPSTSPFPRRPPSLPDQCPRSVPTAPLLPALRPASAPALSLILSLSLTLPLPPVSPSLSVSVSVCPPASDIVFFGENLPARFFSCMQSVSGPGPPHVGADGLPN